MSQNENLPLVIPEHVEKWDEYFQYLAEVAAIKSKDPRCTVGAVIVSTDNVVLATGFNGLARGIHDDDRILGDADEKLKVICHAEVNAIFNAARIGIALQGTSIYVTKFPCIACCNAIIQAGITRIHTHDKRFWDDDPFDGDHKRKRSALRQAGIKVDAPFHPEFTPCKPITLRTPRIPPGSSTQLSILPESTDADAKLDRVAGARKRAVGQHNGRGGRN
jgi:dCMP deaminase